MSWWRRDRKGRRRTKTRSTVGDAVIGAGEVVADGAGAVGEAVGEGAGAALEGMGGCAEGCGGCATAIVLVVLPLAGYAVWQGASLLA